MDALKDRVIGLGGVGYRTVNIYQTRRCHSQLIESTAVREQICTDPFQSFITEQQDALNELREALVGINNIIFGHYQLISPEAPSLAIKAR